MALHSLFWSVAESTQIVTALVALVSVVLGPVLQWRIARRQNLVQIEIAERQVADSNASKWQDWIDELRKDCAAFLQIVTAVELLIYNTRKAGKNPLKELPKFFDHPQGTQASELTFRIRLRLDPAKELQRKLNMHITNIVVTIDRYAMAQSDLEISLQRYELAKLRDEIVEVFASLSFPETSDDMANRAIWPSVRIQELAAKQRRT